MKSLDTASWRQTRGQIIAAYVASAGERSLPAGTIRAVHALLNKKGENHG
jgi:hypothetical protein